MGDEDPNIAKQDKRTGEDWKLKKLENHTKLPVNITKITF